MDRLTKQVRRIFGLSLTGWLLAAVALVQAEPATGDYEERIRSSLKVLLPTLQPDSIRETPLPDIYEVTFGPRLFYVSGDGRYLIQGSVIDLELREDLTEPRLAAAKRNALDAVGEENMLSFGPDDAKYTVSVFTDIDCGYCRKLHSEMNRYNANGIRIRYLFYPRAGVPSESYAKAVSAWCADDPKQALTEAKQGKQIPEKTCENPVASHYQLGQQFGIRGTPALILDDGETLPGYVPASRLKQLLDSRDTAAAAN